MPSACPKEPPRLGSGSTSWGLGWAWFRHCKHSCQWVFRGPWCCSQQGGTPQPPRAWGSPGQLPPGGHTWTGAVPEGQSQAPRAPPHTGGSQGLIHNKYKVRNFGKLAFYALLQLQFQERPSVRNKVLHTGNGNSLFQLMFLGSI